MNRHGRGVIICMMLALPLSCAAQSLAPVHSHPVGKRPQGFVEYALEKINPNGKDYGSAAADTRDDVVSLTIQSIYFWSNVISISLLAATSSALIFVLRAQDKREIIAAHLIAQLWNGRVSDREEIIRRTSSYNAQVESKNAAATGAAASVDEPVEFPASAHPPQKNSSRKTRGASESGAPKQLSLDTQHVGLETPAPDLDQKTKLLEGQNQALRNSERNLRERLNQVSQDLEQERRRNQSLKGA